MFHISATVNFLEPKDNGRIVITEYVAECDIEGPSLDAIWDDIKSRFPTVTSVILSFTNPEMEKAQ